jgi:outer membrane protein TolC
MNNKTCLQRLKTASIVLTALATWLAGAPALVAQEAAPPPLPRETRGSAAEVLTLRQALALAMQNNRDIALARLRYTVTQKEVGLNRSAFLPNLYTGSGAAYTKGFPRTPDGAPTLFNLSYVQTVFNRPLLGQLRAAQERAQIGKLGIEREQEGVVYRTATTYLELAKVRQSLGWLRNERTSAERILEVSRQRAAEGLELPIEITRAQLTLVRIAQRIVQMEGREEVLARQLRDMIGLPPEQAFDVSPDELPHAPEQPVEELLALAVAHSPELKEAELERRARAHRLKGERGGYWPTLDLISFYGLYTKRNNFEDFFVSFERHGFSFGVRAQIPIFSSRTSSAVALAKANLDAADLELKKKRVELDLVVRQESRAARELDATREVARLELQLAQENLKLLQEQYREGRIGLRDLEKARVEEGEKWMAFVDAEYQRQKARLDLLRRTGQLARVLQ